MQAYAIRDASIDKARDLAWLLYYEREDAFHIEICDDVDEWDAPLILSSFVKRRIRSLDPYWSRVWVSQRIVPPDRQNLGMILKENGLLEYDEHRLLVLADGRCAQDDCFIVPLKSRALPQDLSVRLSKTLSAFVYSPDHTLLFFRDGLTIWAPAEELSVSMVSPMDQYILEYRHKAEEPDPRMQQHLLVYQRKLSELRLQPGGHGLQIDDQLFVSSERLREIGQAVPLSANDMNLYMQQNLVDTATAAEILGCTRQNIQDLVRRGKLTPVMTFKNSFLFFKGEL